MGYIPCNSMAGCARKAAPWRQGGGGIARGLRKEGGQTDRHRVLGGREAPHDS